MTQIWRENQLVQTQKERVQIHVQILPLHTPKPSVNLMLLQKSSHFHLLGFVLTLSVVRNVLKPKS
jgi:hypothetical protein